MRAATGSYSLALNAQGDDGAGRQWIHLMPTGPFTGRDGRSWVVSNADRLVRDTLARQGAVLPIDYEHQTDYAPKNGQPAPAAGWIKELQVRPTGIWGLVEWTTRAAEYIRAREYRFISPTFHTTKAGEATTLLRAALTNAPNLELTALTRAQDLNGKTMDHLAELRTLLGLPATSALDAIVEAVRGLVEEKAQNRADPSRFVPIEVLENVTAELNRVQSGVSDEAAAIVVAREIQNGRLVPALRDWGVALCRVNKPAFDGFVQKTGGGLQKLFETTDLGRLPREPGGASNLDHHIARELGHTAEEMSAATSKG